MRQNERGFTLPELLVVIIMTGFFVTLLFSFVFQYLQYGYLSAASLDTLVSRLNAGDYLRESIGTSAGLITQNSIADSNALVPDPAISSNDHWIPMHATPANKPVGSAGTFTPLLYYRRFTSDNSNNLVMNGTQPFEDEYVLYLNGTTKQLLVRSLANPSVANNRILTSCPSNLATSSCPADKILARDISSVDVRYFSRSGNLIDYTSSVDASTGFYNGPDFPSVEAVEFTLHFTVKPIFQKTNAVKSSTVIRIALRNT
jgi:prepilin-type N-terminal cleavage/methylation domain-containing protein